MRSIKKYSKKIDTIKKDGYSIDHDKIIKNMGYVPIEEIPLWTIKSITHEGIIDYYSGYFTKIINIDIEAKINHTKCPENIINNIGVYLYHKIKYKLSSSTNENLFPVIKDITYIDFKVISCLDLPKEETFNSSVYDNPLSMKENSMNMTPSIYDDYDTISVIEHTLYVKVVFLDH